MLHAWGVLRPALQQNMQNGQCFTPIGQNTHDAAKLPNQVNQHAIVWNSFVQMCSDKQPGRHSRRGHETGERKLEAALQSSAHRTARPTTTHTRV